jgi:hypothetical protein
MQFAISTNGRAMMLDVKNVVVDFVTREAFRKQSASYCDKYALKNHGRMDKEIAQKEW